MRTVASYLGHASVSMTLNIYADVDPDAKKAAVSKVQDCFDMNFDLDDGPAAAPVTPPAPGISFTVEQLEAMLQAAKAQQAMSGVA